MAKKSFAVIGIGRFGASVCSELSELGADVLAIDKQESRINKVSNTSTHSVIADSTNENSLKEIGIDKIDHVIVAIGKNVQASILTAVMLEELGVKKITVKVESEYHAKVVQKIGINDIVRPEQSMGKRIARKVLTDNMYEYITLNKDFSVVEIGVKENVIGKNLLDLDIRNKYGVNIIAVRRGEDIFIPKADDTLENQDILVVIGNNKHISKFSNSL